MEEEEEEEEEEKIATYYCWDARYTLHVTRYTLHTPTSRKKRKQPTRPPATQTRSHLHLLSHTLSYPVCSLTDPD